MGPAETRTSIRDIDESVQRSLPQNPSRPSDLRSSLAEILSERPQLAEQIASKLSDSVAAQTPERPWLLRLAEEAGIDVSRLALVEQALLAPRREQARLLRERTKRLEARGVTPIPPVLQPGTRKERTHSRDRAIRAIKVDERHDRHKRELGDEGEQWALAAVVRELLSIEGEARKDAIGQIEKLLHRFKGTPVDAALSHAEQVLSRGLDEDDLIDELREFLHVSQHSDDFGFDLVGWLAPAPGVAPRAMCLEVKSSGGKVFYLSRHEWSRAEQMGESYAVLVVRRSRRGGVPSGMDLLVDPCVLVGEGQLHQEVDGYQIRYGAADEVATQPNEGTVAVE